MNDEIDRILDTFETAVSNWQDEFDGGLNPGTSKLQRYHVEAKHQIEQLIVVARQNELRVLDHNDDKYVLLTDAGLKYFMARMDYLEALKQGEA